MRQLQRRLGQLGERLIVPDCTAVVATMQQKLALCFIVGRIVLPAALLLDLDGTLIESERLQADALARVVAKHGLELTSEERDFVVGHAWQDIFDFLRISSRLGWDLARLQSEAFTARQELEAQGDAIRVIDGGEALVTLANQQAIPVAIVSGSSRAEVAHAIEVLKIGGQLRFFLGSEDYLRGKPAPDSFLLAAQRLGIDPQRCVVVEDSDAGIAAGLAANMRVIATRAALPPEGIAGARDHRRAHLVVDDLRAITWPVLQGLFASEPRS